MKLYELIQEFTKLLAYELLETFRVDVSREFRNALFNTEWYGNKYDCNNQELSRYESSVRIKYCDKMYFEIFPHGSIMLPDESLITIFELVRVITPTDGITWEERFERILFKFI